jgi:hypothetical protein
MPLCCSVQLSAEFPEDPEPIARSFFAFLLAMIACAVSRPVFVKTETRHPLRNRAA